MRRWLILLAVPAVIVAAGTALTAGAAPAVKTQECKGLKVCVKVVGPWVVVPGGLGPLRQSVRYDLSCPKGYTVGGLDAELSDRAIDVTFAARLGSPVNPGISTERDAVFTALYAGSGKRNPSFRPHLGCVPGSGGGGRVQTAVTYRVTKPVVRHMVNAVLLPGTRLVTASCTRKQRLVSAFSSIAFGSTTPPVASRVGTARTVLSVQGRRAVVTARVADTALSSLPVVQTVAVCAVVP